MKNSIFFLFITVLCFSCRKEESIPCIPTSLNDHVVAFYPFSGGRIKDVSDNRLHLVNPNNISPAIDRQRNSSCAYIFDGSTDQFLSRNGRFLDDFHKSCFSVSLWYMPINTRSASKYELLLARSVKLNLNLQGTFSEFGIGLYDCRVPVFNINRRSLRADQILSEDSNSSELNCDDYMIQCQDHWFHLVVTFDKETRIIYVNGRKNKRVINGYYGKSISRNLGDFFIGKGFNGVIDDVIIFDKVLDQNEISQLFNLPACCQ